MKTAEEVLREIGKGTISKSVAVEAMESFAAQSVREDRESRWISVNERYPKFGEYVLICFTGGLTGSKLIKVDYCIQYHNNPIEWKFTSNTSAVTHWQPLPSPPTKVVFE